jgi:hypothetical protein
MNISLDQVDRLNQAIQAYSALSGLISHHSGDVTLSGEASGINFLMRYIEDDLRAVSDSISK